MATIRLPTDFKEFLQLLKKHEVKYLRVGGYAVGYHGYPRATLDMDVWVDRSPENARNLVVVLKEFGFDVADLKETLFTVENRVIRMGMPPIRIEILTGLSGVEFDVCYANRIVDTLDDIDINFIDLFHLKKNKRAAGRYRDLDDLENLP
ncbi:MAG: hypothetical protein H8E17_17480 [Deltaproteobacteria bacterium]|nr:hypothetical protein [Deltaproteobacteria bacterium]